MRIAGRAWKSGSIRTSRESLPPLLCGGAIASCAIETRRGSVPERIARTVRALLPPSRQGRGNKDESCAPPQRPQTPLLHRRRARLPISRSRTSPYGVFSAKDGLAPRIGVAIGDYVLDLWQLAQDCRLDVVELGVSRRVAAQSVHGAGAESRGRARGRGSASCCGTIIPSCATMKKLRSARAGADGGREAASAVRGFRLHRFLFVEGARHQCRRDVPRQGQCAAAELAAHADRLQRPRASTVVVSGTQVTRPRGQLKPPTADVPSFGPCKRLDFELEMGVVVGQPSAMGEMLTEKQAEEMIFGFVILNDWSARDIQQWEYVPLGPFQAKAFATSISPWVVTREALEPFRLHGPAQDPKPLPYLQQAQPNNYDMAARGRPARGADERSRETSAAPISNTCTGRRCSSSCTTPHPAARMNVGDLLGSGTISGPEKHQRGSLLEISWNGTEPVELAGGVNADVPGRRRLACHARLVPGRWLSRRLWRSRGDDSGGGVTALAPSFRRGAKRRKLTSDFLALRRSWPWMLLRFAPQ